MFFGVEQDVARRSSEHDVAVKIFFKVHNEVFSNVDKIGVCDWRLLGECLMSLSVSPVGRQFLRAIQTRFHQEISHDI